MAELEIKPTPRMRLRVLALFSTATGLTFVLIYLLVGGGGDFFARRTTLTTYMPDATGVTTDSEVRLSGIRIGKVKNVELSGQLEPRHVVRVELRVLSRYLKGIPEDSQTDVSEDTLVGDQFIDIAEGKSPLPIKEGGVLQSEPVKEAADRADQLKTLQTDLAGVDKILSDLASPDSIVVGEDLYDNVLLRIRGFDESLHTFLTPQSDLGKAFYTAEMYNRIHGPVVQLDKTLASIQNGEGAAGHVFASNQQYDDLLRQLRGLRTSIADLNAGKGKAGGLLRDDTSYRDLARLLKDTDGVIASLNAGEGQAGRLLSNAQLYESLNGSLRSLQQLLQDLQANPRKFLRFKPF